MTLDDARNDFTTYTKVLELLEASKPADPPPDVSLCVYPPDGMDGYLIAVPFYKLYGFFHQLAEDARDQLAEAYRREATRIEEMNI